MREDKEKGTEHETRKTKRTDNTRRYTNNKQQHITTMSIASGTMQVYDFTDISEPTGDDMEDQDAMLATPSQDSSRKRETRWTERDRELRSFPMAMASKLFFFAACGMLLWMSIDDLYWADEVRNIPEPVLQADDDATWRNFRSRQSRLNNPGTSASASASASSSSNSYSRPSSFGSDGYTEDITWSDIRGSDGGDDRRSLRGGNRVLQQTPVSVPWDDLKFSQQIAAATLGYSPTSWNNGGATFTDSLRWNELTPGQQEAAEQLGYIEEIWNSLRGFSTTTSSTSSTTTSNSANPTGSDWGNFLWSELPADVQAHATNLGYTEDIWNNGQRTIVDDLFWDQLTPQQQFAATTFGYSESTWNVKAQPPTGKDIYPTDPPIPTGTSGGSSGNAIYPITEPPSNSGNTATTTNTNSDTGTNTIPSTGTSGGGSSGNSIYPITEPPSNSGSAGTTTNTNSGTSTNTIPNTGSGSSSSNSATTGDSASNAVDNVDASNRQPTDTSTSTTTTTGTSEQSTSTNGQTTSTSTSTSTTSSTTSTSSSQSATSSTNWRLYKWNELPSDIKAAAITMGFNEALWNSKADVATSEYSWNELSDAQQEAAALLFGYDQAKWDAEYNKRWQGYVWNDLPANIQRGAETLGYNAVSSSSTILFLELCSLTQPQVYADLSNLFLWSKATLE